MKIQDKLVIVLIGFFVFSLVSGIQEVYAVTDVPSITLDNPENNSDNFYQDFFGNSVDFARGYLDSLMAASGSILQTFLSPEPISINSNNEVFAAFSEPGPTVDLELTVVGKPFLGNDVGDADFSMILVNNGPNTAENVIVDMTGTIATSAPTSTDISLTNVCSTFGDPGCIVGILNPGECLVKTAPPGSFGGTCNLGNMSPDTTITFEEHVDIKSGATGEITVSASVSSDSADSNLVNDASIYTVNDSGS